MYKTIYDSENVTRFQASQMMRRMAAGRKILEHRDIFSRFGDAVRYRPGGPLAKLAGNSFRELSKKRKNPNN